VARAVVDAALEVHRSLGQPSSESVYENALLLVARGPRNAARGGSHQVCERGVAREAVAKRASDGFQFARTHCGQMLCGLADFEVEVLIEVNGP
jgi:hypothetical protein